MKSTSFLRKCQAFGLLPTAALGLLTACGGATHMEPRFVAVNNTLSVMGFSQVGAISEGSLPEGEEIGFDVELNAGSCYAYLALGRDGMDDVDVRVFDGEEEIGRDVTHDSQAAARVCAQRSGTHRVVVSAVRGSGSYLLSSWAGGVPTGSGGAMAGGGEGTCSSPIPVIAGTPVSGTTRGAPNQLEPVCVNGAAGERVYQLVVEERAHYDVRIESDYDGVLSIFDGCGPNAQAIGCNDDDGDTAHSRLATTLSPGTYFIVVDGFGDAEGGFTLFVDQRDLPSVAALCSAAPVLAQGQPVQGSTQGEIDSFQSVCAGGSGGADNVYRLDVPQRSRMRLLMEQSGFDGSLHVRSTCDNPGTEVACNDDFMGTSRSLITRVMDPGTYYVVADGYGSAGSGNAGNYTLHADLAPANGGGAAADSCASTQPAPTTATRIDTLAAADDYAGSCGGRGAADVVYELNLSARSRVTVEVTESQFEGAFYIRRACDVESSEVFCQSFVQGANGPAMGPNGQPVSNATDLDPGRYFVIFDGIRPESFGAATVNVNVRDLSAARRACQRAPMLRPGRTTNGTTAGESNDSQASCAQRANSGDRVYRFRVNRRSDVRFNMTGDYDGALYIRRDCLDQSSELACNDDNGNNRTSTIVTTLDRGTYFLFVDGFGTGSEGSFSLEFQTGRPGTLPRVQQPPPGIRGGAIAPPVPVP